MFSSLPWRFGAESSGAWLSKCRRSMSASMKIRFQHLWYSTDVAHVGPMVVDRKLVPFRCWSSKYSTLRASEGLTGYPTTVTSRPVAQRVMTMEGRVMVSIDVHENGCRVFAVWNCEVDMETAGRDVRIWEKSINGVSSWFWLGFDVGKNHVLQGSGRRWKGNVATEVCGIGA